MAEPAFPVGVVAPPVPLDLPLGLLPQAASTSEATARNEPISARRLLCRIFLHLDRASRLAARSRADLRPAVLRNHSVTLRRSFPAIASLPSGFSRGPAQRGEQRARPVSLGGESAGPRASGGEGV